jgi:hypothetical protein
MDPYFLGSRARIRIRVKAGSASAIMSEFRSFRGSKWSLGGLWTITVEAWRLKMEPWRVCRPVVANSHHIDEE